MEKKRIIVLLCIVVIGLSSCCRKMYPVSVKEQTYDSTLVQTREVLRDTVIIIPEAQSSLQIDADEVAQALQTGSKPIVKEQTQHQATVKVKVSEKGIEAECHCDTMAIMAKLKDTYTDKEHIRVRIKTETVQVKYVPAMVKYLAWTGGIALVLGIGLIIRKFI